MARFRYRLQPLLDQKLRAQKAAEEAMVAAQREHQQAKAREQELREEEQRLGEKKSRLRRELLSNPGGGTLSAPEVQQRKAYLQGLGEDIERARDAVFSQGLVVGECEQKVAAAARLVDECTRKVDVLKKHRAKLEKRFYAEIEAKEALEQDELGNVMFLMRQRNG